MTCAPFGNAAHSSVVQWSRPRIGRMTYGSASGAWVVQQVQWSRPRIGRMTRPGGPAPATRPEGCNGAGRGSAG